MQAAGIATYLQGNPDYTVAAKFVQLADAPAIFGDSPEAGIVLFAASDSAWKTAADALGERLSWLRQSQVPIHCCMQNPKLCAKHVA
jgi:hypothetical protein